VAMLVPALTMHEMVLAAEAASQSTLRVSNSLMCSADRMFRRTKSSLRFHLSQRRTNAHGRGSKCRARAARASAPNRSASHDPGCLIEQFISPGSTLPRS
jgi:hypothetical protein